VACVDFGDIPKNTLDDCGFVELGLVSGLDALPVGTDVDVGVRRRRHFGPGGGFEIGN
jgi:hypothetical protein